MVKPGCKLGLAQKAFPGVFVVCQVIRKELYGYDATEKGVFSLEDAAATSFTQFFKEMVLLDTAADHRTYKAVKNKRANRVFDG